MEFRPATGALGADVHGIDLSCPLDPGEETAIRDGLARHQVLFFREQPLLSQEQHLAFASRFGEPEPTPFRRPGKDERTDMLVLDQTDPKGSAAARFHADNTFREEPPIGAVLQARIVPDHGGDTCFASMHAAFEALSPAMQHFLEGLDAYHAYGQMVMRLSRSGMVKGLDPDAHPPRKHPVIAHHPVTGRKLLNVNYNWTTHIDGLTADESDAVLRLLYEHVKNPDFQVRLRWNVGDVVFWDNRAVQHHAVADYGERRLIHRISLLPHQQVGAPAEREAIAAE